MEFETRALKWYWVGLFIAYVFTVTYFLFKANPYLYSQASLKSRASSFEDESIHPQPRPEEQFALKSKPTGFASWPYLNSSRANVADAEVTRGKTFKEHELFNLNPQPTKDAKFVAFDSSQLLILEDDGSLLSYSPNGELKWHYKISPENFEKDSKQLSILMDSSLVYLTLKRGRILALDKALGRPQWMTELDADLLSTPWLSDQDLVVSISKQLSQKGKKSSSKSSIVEFIFIDREKGVIQKRVDGFEHKGPFTQVPAPWIKARVFVHGNRVMAVSEAKLKTEMEMLWSSNLAEEIFPAPAVYENKIFLTTQTGRLIVLDAAKKGQPEIEVDLDGAPETEVTPIPLTQKVAYLTKAGVLRVVDIQKGQGAWKYDLNIRGPVRHLWSARLKGAFIQEFGMSWAHKGWTIWAPCGSNQYCIYNPDRGQLINRIELSGEPMSLPLVFDRKLIAIIKKPTGELAISHNLEPSEIKRLEAP